MNPLLHQIIETGARSRPEAEALRWRGESLTYAALAQAVAEIAGGLQHIGLQPGARVAVYLPKQPQTVISLFATAQAGGIFVPVNPLLKPAQVAHILHDSGASVLVTSRDRAALLQDIRPTCPALRQVVLVDADVTAPGGDTIPWPQLRGHRPQPVALAPTDSVAILYTSGSTGRPKGVELSHRNLVTGAHSVAEYLHLGAQDRLLAVLPLSFDYGLSQLTSAFLVGAGVVLMEYLLPGEVIKALARDRITGLAGVPSLWTQLAEQGWPEDIQRSLRFITNSGGALPQTVLRRLQTALPQTAIYLMYGLTEAFRSTYLDPAELSRRPTSIGKAIPHAHVSVRRPDGSLCAPGEAGELVHTGPLVAKGYWRNPAASAERFRPLPGSGEPAVWSGDSAVLDTDGFLYFLGRHDDQIKTSGYRVSPTEVEEVLYASGLVREAAVVGIEEPLLGQAIAAYVVPAAGATARVVDDLSAYCQQALPAYMVPRRITLLEALPKTPHGKIDRPALARASQPPAGVLAS